MGKYYVKDIAKKYGVKLKNLKIEIKSLKMSKPKVQSVSPLKFKEVRTVCKGTAKAKVYGRSINTSFTYKSTIEILD